MKRSTKISLVAALLVLISAGVAIAAWNVTGTGSGAGKAAGTVPLVVTAGAAAGDLYPGSTTGDVFVQVKNNNTFPVKVTTVAVAGPVSSAASSCALTVNGGPLSLTAAAPTIGAGQTADLTIADALTMGTAADTLCQNTDITVAGVTVNGTAF